MHSSIISMPMLSVVLYCFHAEKAAILFDPFPKAPCSLKLLSALMSNIQHLQTAYALSSGGYPCSKNSQADIPRSQYESSQH